MSIKTILSSIGYFIKNLLPWAKQVTLAGTAIANQVKAAVDSPLANLVVNLTPTNLDNAGLVVLRAWLVIVYKDLGLINTLTDDFTEATSKASASIALMQTPEAKAGTLNTLAAAVSTKVAAITGQELPIQTTLALQQSAYVHPELFAA